MRNVEGAMGKTRRGDWIKTGGGDEGRYVGTSPGGCVWVCYGDSGFEAMCRAFDAQARRS